MADKHIVSGLDLHTRSKVMDCGPCMEGKMANGPMISKSSLSRFAREVVHTDVCTMKSLSIGGAKYFVTFIDEASGHLSASPLKLRATPRMS